MLLSNDTPIISLTSHGIRMKYVARTIFSIISGTYKNIHIVLSIGENDVKSIPDELKVLIDAGTVELIVGNDLGPHTKYFYTMCKYKCNPIITIDDDGLYEENTVQSLMNSYLHDKTCIHARRVHKIEYSNRNIKPYRQWIFDYTKENNPSMILFATGVGGVLYPPDILNISEENINEIKSCLYADDIYLKVLEIRKNVKVKWVKNNCFQPKKFSDSIDKEIKLNGLWKINTLKDRNDIYINIFKSEFSNLC